MHEGEKRIEDMTPEEKKAHFDEMVAKGKTEALEGLSERIANAKVDLFLDQENRRVWADMNAGRNAHFNIDLQTMEVKPVGWIEELEMTGDLTQKVLDRLQEVRGKDWFRESIALLRLEAEMFFEASPDQKFDLPDFVK